MTSPGNTGGDQQGQGTGTGTGTGGTAPQQGQGSGTGTPPADDWSDRDAWRSLAQELGLKPDEVKTRLQHARTWEDRAKANRDAAQQKTTLEQQVEQMRTALAQRDEQDIERETRTARKSLRAELIEAGLDGRDADEAIELVDLGRLLKDNVADDKLITETAKRLAKVAGRAQPDRDQGAGGNGQQQGAGGMDNWVHQQVNRSRGRR